MNCGQINGIHHTSDFGVLCTSAIHEGNGEMHVIFIGICCKAKLNVISRASEVFEFLFGMD